MTAAILTEGIRSLVPKAARRKPDNSARLAGALNQLSMLESKRLEIIAFNDAVLRALATFQEQEQSAEVAFATALKSGDLQQVRQALAMPVNSGRVEFARRQSSAITATRQYGGERQQFISENRDAKEVLMAVCKCKLDRAKAELDSITAGEGMRLGGAYSADEVANSPPVRRAAGKVTELEHVLHRIKTEKIETLWVNFAQQLLG